jgi:hypothetical protein
MAGRKGANVGPRPHTWVTGTDPLRHEMYHNWARARAQAHHRGEVWNLEFTEWEQFWSTDWSQRGRGGDNLCITRIDHRLPWAWNNICKITRRHLAFQSQSRRAR